MLKPRGLIKLQISFTSNLYVFGLKIVARKHPTFDKCEYVMYRSACTVVKSDQCLIFAE